ncbi:MAG TPA: rRNA maturation RNase YbeY [Pantanalinema sp.]
MEILLDDQSEAGLDLARWEGLVAEMLVAAGVEDRAEVSVTFVDDAAIHALNLEHRQKDRPTDVLSFPQFEPDEDFPPEPIPFSLGDVVVSVETAARQAEEYGHPFEREVGFLLAHGLLHLLGHDHQTPDEEAEMRARQRALLEAVGLGREGEEA